MSGLVCAIFTVGVSLTGFPRMLLLVPLCMSISIVYKTVKSDDLRTVPLASVVLCATVIVSMYAVGVGLWLLFQILA